MTLMRYFDLVGCFDLALTFTYYKVHPYMIFYHVRILYPLGSLLAKFLFPAVISQGSVADKGKSDDFDI